MQSESQGVDGHPAPYFRPTAACIGALERGVQRLDAHQVAERWDEVRAWMRRVIATWVQRYKMLNIKRLESGIRVEIESQDDYGYYNYGFDVFPKREAGPAKKRKSNT